MSGTDSQLFFDSDYYQSVNIARDEVFHGILPSLVKQLTLKSVLDVGCGVGYYAAYLQSLELQVVGIDGRAENVALARQRCPSATFAVGDIEQLSLADFGQFDMVFCAGLLYHLENPFRAIRQLNALCNSICVIESRVYWSGLPGALLVQEAADNPTQALAQYAWVLSRQGMIDLLYAAGFHYVYSAQVTSQHIELKRRTWHQPRRLIFVAARNPIPLSTLHLEHQATNAIESASMYARNWRRFMQSLRDAFGWLG